MTWMTTGHELRALYAMNNSRLWMTWMTLGHELTTLDAMNNWGLWMIWTILGHKLKALDTKDWNIGFYGYISTSILRIYRKYRRNIGEITVDIFSQISIESKLFKINKNIWKNFKNDKISKNTHFKVLKIYSF